MAVSIALAADELELRVIDDGVGFDPVKAQRARVAGHIGLGRLHRLADRLGGAVEIDAAVPVGTCVVVRLPAAALIHRGVVPDEVPQPQHPFGREMPAGHAIMSAAENRDVTATSEDLVSAARDRAATLREMPTARRLSRHPGDSRLRSVTAGYLRARPRGDAALLDREHAAADRERGASQRLLAAADRNALSAQLAHAETDPLTGVRTRSAGLEDLGREVDRTHRSDGVLSVTYLDVVGLKAVNDVQGHAAGDLLLQRVIATVRERLRPYDMIVRLGGDEFVCVMPGLLLVTAQQRFAGIVMRLAKPPGAQIRTGFAQLGSADTTLTLIARADQNLLQRRDAPNRPAA